MELAVVDVADPEDVAEAEAGEDLVVVPRSEQTLSHLLKFEIGCLVIVTSE